MTSVAPHEGGIDRQVVVSYRAAAYEGSCQYHQNSSGEDWPIGEDQDQRRSRRGHLPSGGDFIQILGVFMYGMVMIICRVGLRCLVNLLDTLQPWFTWQ